MVVGSSQTIPKKCGEIFINFKAKNTKTKIYTFNCSFCDANCNQLKKFSLHLEENHLEQFSEKSEHNTLVFRPEIKDEHLNNIEINDKLAAAESILLNEDPLQENEIPTTEIESKEILLELKEEEIEKQIYQVDYENCDSNKDEIDNPDDLEDNKGNYTDNTDFLQDNNDNCTDNTDFLEVNNDNCTESYQSDYNDGHLQLSKLKKRKKVTITEESDEKAFKSKRKRCSIKHHFTKTEIDVNDRDLCLALLKAFEKQTILWKVKKRTKYKKINQQYYEIIANEVNEKLNCNINWEDAKEFIKNMRNQYSLEMQKKNNGEEYELPWYTEHLNFLQENIKVLLKCREGLKKYKPLKTMDDSELSILIDIYKKHADLWQVNNIAFGAKRKKDEIFEKIVEDLNQNHNFNTTTDNLQRRVNYMMRIYSKNRMNQLKCELEKKKFEPSSLLYEKMTFLYESEGPFKCSHCNEIIQRYDNYHIHVAKHIHAVPFQCPLCEKSFHKYNYYIIHARRHMELNNHFCKFCDRGFPTTIELAVHERGHTGEYPYLCQICGATFKAPNSYGNHIRRHENRFRYNCHICNHGFNHANELNNHVKAHLDIRDMVCNICGKGFTSPKHLRNHKLIHSDEKRYKCKICDKAFAQTAGLRQHRKQHQPFSVQYKKKSNLSGDSM